MSKHTPNTCICGKKPVLITIAAKAQVWCSDETGCGRRSIRCGSIPETMADWNRLTAAPDLLKALSDIANQKPEEWQGGFMEWAQGVATAAIDRAEPKP